uniref:PEHE domain-containing protein n=1 Tax=Loa loa TaxID=7209 RepID=A0A1I7VVJ5_LOALO
MSIHCASLHQIVPPPTKNSGRQLPNGNFESGDTSSGSIDSLIAFERDDPDFRIRQRLEASRQGMLQLEALRSKHQKLMQEMRIRLPHRINMERPYDDSRKHKGLSVANPQTEIKLNDLRCDSPVSCCVSHRSSVSMDSGCVSLSSDFSSQSPMPSNTNRKFSLEDQRKKTEQNVTTAEVETDENSQLVAMAIESTTALRCNDTKCCTNWPRPKSMYFNYPVGKAVVVDSLSFSQITPPPTHRKFFTIGRSESVQKPLKNCQITPQQSVNLQPDRQSIFHASRIFLNRSPRIMQCGKQRMNIDKYDSDEESPRLLRAQPAVVLSRQQSYAHSNESSPRELRKVHLIENPNSLSNAPVLEYHQQLNRYENSQNPEIIVSDRTRRRRKEKDWKESEDL